MWMFFLYSLNIVFISYYTATGFVYLILHFYIFTLRESFEILIFKYLINS